MHFIHSYSNFITTVHNKHYYSHFAYKKIVIQTRLNNLPSVPQSEFLMKVYLALELIHFFPGYSVTGHTKSDDQSILIRNI